MRTLISIGVHLSKSNLSRSALQRSSNLKTLRFPHVEQITLSSNNMSTIRDLELEKQQLEAKVHKLVDQLENLKSGAEIKVDKDLVIKSKEDRDASQAMEQLELNEKEDKTRPTNQDPSKNVEPKKASGGKQPKGGAKEPEKPLDASRLDLRIGKIVQVDRHPDADSLYVEKIDCGEASGPRTVISGLVNHVPIDEMRERMVLVLCNLKPVKMRGILSEAMVMCASTPEKVELLQPPAGVKPGDRVTFEKYPGEPDTQLNPKKKVWEQVSPDIKTNDDGVAFYKDCEFRVAGNDGKFTSSLKNVNIR